jgi:hypothetical protein
MMYAIATGLLVLAVIVCAVRGVMTYRSLAGTRQQRFTVMFRNSEVVLLGFVQALVAAALAVIKFCGDFFNDPTITSGLQGLFKADYIPIYLAGIAVVTYLARMIRTEPDPVTGEIVPPPPAPKN